MATYYIDYCTLNAARRDAQRDYTHACREAANRYQEAVRTALQAFFPEVPLGGDHVYDIRDGRLHLAWGGRSRFESYCLPWGAPLEVRREELAAAVADAWDALTREIRRYDADLRGAIESAESVSIRRTVESTDAR